MSSLQSVRNFETVSVASKHALVVGGTSGIGEGIALNLAKLNCAVTIAGRDAARGADVVKRLQNASTDDAVRAAHKFEPLDASLLQNCRTFADKVKRAGPLDLLVMTQGVMTMAGFSPTSEGVDRKLALHYFSRATLALDLAPTLSQSSDGRVLTVLSPGAHAPFDQYATDFELSNGSYSPSNAARAGCMYNDVLAEQLHADFPKLTVTHAAPGFVATNLGSDLPWYIRVPARAAMVFATSIEECGEMLSVSLLRGAPFQGNWHLVNRAGQPVSKTPLHDQAKDDIWRQTKALIERVAPRAN